MDKIDPKLWELISAHAAGELPPDPDNPDFLTHVYVAAENGDFGGIAAAGFDVASELDGTGIVTLAIPDIETLADRADVLAIFAPRSGEPQDGPDKAITTEQATVHLVEAHTVTSHNRPAGSHGEDVIVGIVDSGVNILHDAFTFTTTENGKTVRKTRILAYWAQSRNTRRGTTPLWERSGKVYTEAEINVLLAAFDTSKTLPPANVLDLDDDGNSAHGTGVASVAAGSDWPAGPDALGIRTGIAPAAKLIVVGGQVDDIAGIEFCFAKAGASACVVNMSLGHFEEPHNGLSMFSRRLRSLLTQGSPRTFIPGRAFVTAAGNEGLNHNHFQLSLQQAKVIEVVVDPKEIKFGCLISSSKPGLKVSVSPPSGRRSFTPAGPYAGKREVADHLISIGTLPSIQQQTPDDLASDTDSHILVDADRKITGTGSIFVRPGVWQIRLDPGTDPHPKVDIWQIWGTVLDSQKLDDPDFEFGWAMEDDGHGMERRWARRKEWIEGTLRSQPTTAVAIVAGGTKWFTVDQLVGPDRYASRGPTTDAGLPAADMKPDIAAPNDNILIARWRRPRRASDKPSGSARANGTSFASPCIAGAVALMLSHDPTLNQDDIRQMLRSTTSPWAAKVRQVMFVDRQINEHNIAGKGFLNIEAALKAVKTRVGP